MLVGLHSILESREDPEDWLNQELGISIYSFKKKKSQALVAYVYKPSYMGN